MVDEEQSGATRGQHVNRVESRIVPDHGDCKYFLYRPEILREHRRMLVSVHGITRNALEHAMRFRAWADQLGMAVVAPLFGKEDFNQYQTMRQTAHKPSPDEALNIIVAHARRELGMQDGRIMLFGYSGGGQFAHRFALKHPETIERLAVGAAGWYTYPDSDIPYPRGLAGVDGGRPFAESAVLAKFPPTLVVVGSDDDIRDGSLNKNPKIDRQQGENRLARGMNWCNAMNAAAQQAGLNPICRFIELPDAGHDFSACMQAGLDRVVVQFFQCDIIKGD